MSEDKHFCPNCGHEIKPGADFCPNCGHKLNSNSQPQQSASASSNKTVNPTPRRVKKPMSKKSKISYSVLLLIILILVGGYLWGNHYYSKEATASRIVNSIKDGNKKQVADDSSTTDPSYKITPDNMSALIKYFGKNKYKFASFENQLSDDDDNTSSSSNSLSNFELKQDGNAFLVFPRYKLSITPVYGQIDTNGKKLKVNIDGNKSKLAIDDDSSSKSRSSDDYDSVTGNVGPLTPGSHKITVIGTVNGKETHSTSDVDWITGKNNTLSTTLDSGVASKEDAKSTLSSVFSDVGSSSISSDNFVGDDSNAFYNDIDKMNTGWRKDKSIDYFSEDSCKVISVAPGKGNETKVVFDVKYILNQENGDKKTQTMEYSVILVPSKDSDSRNKKYLIKNEFAKRKVVSTKTDTSNHHSDDSSSSSSDNNDDNNNNSDSNSSSSSDSNNSNNNNDDSSNN
ncbi:TcaA second domain-containing protein [Fructilactobacillus sanfranciscensis]|uniref:Uncharacterized protein n=1 Tax=Fructilactobacillus sanfranciscensis TaxID=1625 RepID=A0A5C4TIS2_FRUSA|nr:zinc-ribbon domain-containing protein [Fructilactobacillus sanfranciscensis]TNK90458.1 hypothetical protein DID87_03910 [Fructilactobacillus sanfranciscensis]TNL00354.1 hypothetical protein DK130_00700 [Fructilactobacillus sanfranciscensis]